jgi:predicted nucleic acid-binding protein
MALFDTNILIDFLNGVPEARKEIWHHDRKAISIITWMEVMAGADEDVETTTRAFLHAFELLPLNSDTAERAVQLRREHRLKLPDAIILASAQVHAMVLVTRNTRDFGSGTPGVRVPYAL